MVTVVPGGGEHVWRALHEGETVGELVAVVRPDQRCVLMLRNCKPRVVAPLVDRAASELARDCYVDIDEDDEVLAGQLRERGFAISRREHHYELPVDPERTGLVAAPVPPGVEVITAARADRRRLRVLDDILRQDVPGTDGWRNDPHEFDESTFGSSAFDPATYLVAADQTSGEYVGLCRVWWNERGPRAGMVGVVAPWRRRGLARALVAQAWDVVWQRGHATVSAEVDASNVASNTLCAEIGGVRVGGTVELVRRVPPASG